MPCLESDSVAASFPLPSAWNKVPYTVWNPNRGKNKTMALIALVEISTTFGSLEKILIICGVKLKYISVEIVQNILVTISENLMDSLSLPVRPAP